MEDRETLGQNLSEDGIYVGDPEDTADTTGDLEGVRDLGWVGQ